MKWHYTTVHFDALTQLGLSLIEYALSDLAYHQTKAGTQWWEYSPSEIGELLGISEKTVRDAYDRCVEKGTVLKESKSIMCCQEFIDVVYPSNGRNYRDGGRNYRQATEETTALYNNIVKEEIGSVSPRTFEVIEVSDEELDERKPSRLTKTEKEKLQPLVGWAERERGFLFLSSEQGKQLKALSLAKKNGLKAAELKERWNDMAGEKFWIKTGFDWMNVVLSFNKKGV